MIVGSDKGLDSWVNSINFMKITAFYFNFFLQKIDPILSNQLNITKLINN